MIVVDERQFRSAVLKASWPTPSVYLSLRSSSTTGEVIRGERWGSACAHLGVSSRRGCLDSWTSVGGWNWGKGLGKNGGKRDDIFVKDRIELVKVDRYERNLTQWNVSFAVFVFVTVDLDSE